MLKDDIDKKKSNLIKNLKKDWSELVLIFKTVEPSDGPGTNRRESKTWKITK